MKRKTKTKIQSKEKEICKTVEDDSVMTLSVAQCALARRRVPWRVISAATLLCFGIMCAPVSAFALNDADCETFTTVTGIHSIEQMTDDSAMWQAAEVEQRRTTAKFEYKLVGVSNKSIYAYSRMTTIVNGERISMPSIVINGVTYLPLRAVADALGAGSVNYDSVSRCMTISGNGLDLSVTDGGFVIYANGRTLFSFSPCVIMSNGRMYVPASAFAKASGTRFTLSGDSLHLDGSFSPLVSASSFYRDDEVLWLARMISAEAKGESLIGQIAVGNVIMNRVRSPLYPNTIWGVIFDRRYGVQFSPVLNGSVYDNPTYTATLAARICLEGTTLSEDALFFVNPEKAPNSWIAKNRVYAYTIGNHDFYY